MKQALVLATIVVGMFATQGMAADSATRPNILFILADDYGLDGVSCYGSDRFRGKTPHLDALAAAGTRFTQCYSMPLCGPTRCTLMTGRYGFRTGGTTNMTAGQPSFRVEPSVARTLKQAGYVTGMAGKWRQMGDTPGDWGFDEWLTDPTAGGWFWKTSYTKNGQEVVEKEEVYVPDVCLEFTRDFLKRHREQPFFFYFPTHLIHGPILRTPDSRGDSPADYYQDDVSYLDKQVGLLVAELDKLGLREKTLVVFSADNGTARFGSDQSVIEGKRISGQKGTMLEGGARVPLIASWPGTTPPGKVSHDLIDFTDFFATFASVGGAKLPEGTKFDSRSFAPQLRGEPGKPRDWIFVQLGAKWYVREQGYKLNESGELFDMREAPFTEKLVPGDASDAAASAARDRLQAVLKDLNPAQGKNSSNDSAGKGKATKKKLRKTKKATAA